MGYYMGILWYYSLNLNLDSNLLYLVNLYLYMQKFEDSFDGAYSSSGKKNQQQSTKKSKIIINVAGFIFFLFSRDTISCC